MKALVLEAVKQPLVLEGRESGVPGRGEALVRLTAAALNRRDYWITRGLYPGIRTPVILGSDGTGVVSVLGEDVQADWQGREVILYPGLDWGEGSEAQGPDFRILGMPDDGTFADEIIVPSGQLFAKPEFLTAPEAAALPLAGLTAYRALFTQGRLTPGERVLITGIGGGVATMAMQFALAAGADVSVTSSSEEKIERAVKLGATHGVNYKAEGWGRSLARELGPMHLIIDSAGGQGYADLIEAAAPGGRIVNYGATAGSPEGFDLFKVFWKQLHLIGTTMGSRADFEAMLEVVERHQIRPWVDQVFALENGNDALSRLGAGGQFGKIVLETTSGS